MIAALFYFTAGLAAVLASIAVFKDRSARGRRVLAAGLVLVAWQLCLSAQIQRSGTLLEADYWRSWWFLPQALSPSVWLLFTLKFARGNFELSLKRWYPVLALVFAVPLASVFLFSDALFVSRQGPGGPVFQLGIAGYYLYLCVVLSSALILINLERTFRAAVGTMRWRIKFIILGTATLFTAKLYTSSQVLLFKTHPYGYDIVGGVAAFLACLLFLRGLLRTGIFQVQVYPSEKVLQFSIAGVLIGAYLVLIGLATKLFSAWNGPEAFAAKAFLLLASLAFVGVLILSEKTRDRLKRFVSRHFHRPFYDYRAVWLSLTERTGTVMEPDAFSRVVVQWISEQLRVMSVSMWLVEEPDEIRLAASTAVASFEPTNPAESAELIRALLNEPLPFDIDQRSESWIPALQRYCHGQFQRGANRFCVPLVAERRLVGFCTLGDRVNAIPLDHQEAELLKCVGDQIAANLLNRQLSTRLVQAKEMEAFQTIAAFFVHDLKNTASSLNLTLQNLPKHFDNPEFRKDAFRSIGKSVNHIQDLISRLTLFRDKLEVVQTPVDLNAVIRSCLDSLRSGALPITASLSEIKPVSGDADQLHKVILNLLLNARDALKPNQNGRIEIRTVQENGCAVLSVSDNGIGMTPEFVARSLFRPFKTTKKGGIGIGMFQIKAIVQAHGGRIHVDSEPGKGTTFYVSLPMFCS